MIEKDIIQDQKETIKRLQQECTEKTDIILKLGGELEDLRQLGLDLQEKIQDYEEANERLEVDSKEIRRKLEEWEKELQSNERIINRLIKENEKMKQALEEVKQICDWRNEYNSIGIDDYKKIIKDVENKVNEVLGNEKIHYT